MTETLAGPLLELIPRETEICESPHPFTRPNDLQELSVQTHSLTYCYVLLRKVFSSLAGLYVLSAVSVFGLSTAGRKGGIIGFSWELC